MSIISNYKVGISHCIVTRRPDFIALVSIAILTPLLSLFGIHAIVGEPIALLSLTSTPFIILTLFLLSIAGSKPLLVFYATLKPNRTLYDFVMSITNHISAWCLAGLLASSHSGQDGDHSQLAAAVILGASFTRLIWKTITLKQQGAFRHD